MAKSTVTITTDLKAFNEMDKTLERLGDRVTRNAAASALRAAGKVIKDDAKARLPGNYRKLAKSIGVKILKPRDQFNRAAVIGTRVDGIYSEVGFYGVIVEYGTLGSRTHPLSPKTHRKVGRSGTLPEGLKPRPFLRPAVDTTRQRQLKAMSEQLANYLRKRGLV